MAKSKAKTQELSSGIERQKLYLQQKKALGLNNDSLFITEKVMESMRDSGYRDIRKAVNDLIDNSEQAGAKKIAVVTTTAKEGQKNAKEKISNIAVIDDGHGMLPEMLVDAIKWGGTDRHNEREGLGRFGFGLPTAAISVSKAYDVYSKVSGGEWHKVSVDLKEITTKALHSGGNVSFIPQSTKVKLPDFVSAYLKKVWKKDDPEQGTVVLLKNPDRIRRFAMPQAFQAKMMQNIGLTYRHFIPDVSFYVNDKSVDMIDPLFLNPNCIGYKSDNGLSAEGRDEMILSVKNKLLDGEVREGNIKVKFSFMHPKFQRDKSNREIPNRMNTMIENNGYFIVCRAGRQIDIVRETGYQSEDDNVTIVNYDRNWAIELDFDPILDELFGITTNKQQVEIDSYLWDIFKENNIPATVKKFRADIQALINEGRIKVENEEEANRDSEVIMMDADKFDRLRIPDEKLEQASENLRNDAIEIAKEKNEDIESVIEKLESEAEKKKYKIEFTELPGAPFYDIDQWGPQTKVKINASHRFFSDIYSLQDTRAKTGLELLLFIIGKCELESVGDRNLFYGNERYEWSRQLELRLKMLDKKDPVIDSQSFNEEKK